MRVDRLKASIYAHFPVEYYYPAKDGAAGNTRVDSSFFRTVQVYIHTHISIVSNMVAIKQSSPTLLLGKASFLSVDGYRDVARLKKASRWASTMSSFPQGFTSFPISVSVGLIDVRTVYKGSVQVCRLSITHFYRLPTICPQF